MLNEPDAAAGRNAPSGNPSAGSPANDLVVVELVAAEAGIDKARILGRARSRDVAEARQIAMYLLAVAEARSFAVIGRRFGRCRQTVAYACGKSEDLREEPAFDMRISALEDRLADVASGVEAADA